MDNGLKLAATTRLHVWLWRILTWQHPCCVNCQDSNRASLRRHPNGLWVCVHCARNWKYRHALPASDEPAKEAAK